MDAMQKVAAAATRVYQDFAPQTELIVEADCDTLLVYLSGFKKEQLRVQLTKTRNLIISGEHPVGDNIWRRFQKTFPLSTDVDVGKITAKFEDLVLYITLPKLIIASTAEVNKQDDEEKPTSSTKAAPSAEKQDDEEKPTSTKAPESPKPVNEQKHLNNPAERIDEKSNAPDASFSEKANEQAKNMPEMAPGNNQKHEIDSSSGMKMERKVMYCVLMAILLALVIGLYVQILTKFFGGGGEVGN